MLTTARGGYVDRCSSNAEFDEAKDANRAGPHNRYGLLANKYQSPSRCSDANYFPKTNRRDMRDRSCHFGIRNTPLSAAEYANGR